MGNTSYNYSNRVSRAKASGFHTKSMNQLFAQNTKRVVHNSMDIKDISYREARDSKEHPNSFPIILGLDVTGSMGYIPHYLLKEGLPMLVDSLIQGGIDDPAILFTAIGDHLNDSYPFQVGQFESGDEELDMWLQRCYVESRGGANNGESYSLLHYFASNNIDTDHFIKGRGKGVLITIGDEPNHANYSSSDMERVFGNGDIGSFTSKDIVEQASEKWDIYHIIPRREKYPNTMSGWKDLLGENNVFFAETQEDVANTIKDICLNRGNFSRGTKINTDSQEVL